MPSGDEGPGTRIGAYKLLQQIGEGGMGVVLSRRTARADAAGPVALKLIKLGMDTHEVVSRFEAERQALALMDHSKHRVGASMPAPRATAVRSS